MVCAVDEGRWDVGPEGGYTFTEGVVVKALSKLMKQASLMRMLVNTEIVLKSAVLLLGS